MHHILNNNEIAELNKSADRIRKMILDMTFSTGSAGAHVGGSLSMVEILTVLYKCVLNYRKEDPCWLERDRVILSKGHAAMALYAVFAEISLIKQDELGEFKKNGSILTGHPSLNGVPGIEFASGSLGQGLSLGVGVSLTLKMKSINKPRVYVLLGDGECDEGSIWEAAASASHYGCNNLFAVVDRNGFQYDGKTSKIMSIDPLDAKWQAFGWNVITVDGHNIKSIIDGFNMNVDGPTVIIADTVKGKGVSFMENNTLCHNMSLTEEQYHMAIDEISKDKND